MRDRMALYRHESGLRQLCDLFPAHADVSHVIHIISNDEERRLDIILLQQREKLGIVILMPVVKGQDNGLVILVHMLKILEPYRVIAVIHQILEILLHRLRTDCQRLLRTQRGNVVRNIVIHQHRNAVPLRQDPVSGGGSAVQMIVLVIHQQRYSHLAAVSQELHSVAADAHFHRAPHEIQRAAVGRILKVKRAEEFGGADVGHTIAHNAAAQPHSVHRDGAARRQLRFGFRRRLARA